MHPFFLPFNVFTFRFSCQSSFVDSSFWFFIVFVLAKVRRKTVGVALLLIPVEKTREHKLNISRITIQVLTSTISCLEKQIPTEAFFVKLFHESKFYGFQSELPC